MIDRFRPHLTGLRTVALAFLLPMADGAVNGASAWPVWSALNAPGLPTVIVQAAGALSVGLAVLLVWLVTRPSAAPVEPRRDLAKVSRA
jgi:hypothetical protein